MGSELQTSAHRHGGEAIWKFRISWVFAWSIISKRNVYIRESILPLFHSFKQINSITIQYINQSSIIFIFSFFTQVRLSPPSSFHYLISHSPSRNRKNQTSKCNSQPSPSPSWHAPSPASSSPTAQTESKPTSAMENAKSGRSYNIPKPPHKPQYSPTCRISPPGSLKIAIIY